MSGPAPELEAASHAAFVLGVFVREAKSEHMVTHVTGRDGEDICTVFTVVAPELVAGVRAVLAAWDEGAAKHHGGAA